MNMTNVTFALWKWRQAGKEHGLPVSTLVRRKCRKLCIHTQTQADTIVFMGPSRHLLCAPGCETSARQLESLHSSERKPPHPYIFAFCYQPELTVAYMQTLFPAALMLWTGGQGRTHRGQILCSYRFLFETDGEWISLKFLLWSLLTVRGEQ